jgi:chromosome segregation ATPase
VWDCTLTVPVMAGQGPYSLVLAGRGTLPRMRLAAAFAPSTRLDHLHEASEQIEEQRRAMDDDQRRVAEERGLVLAEREDLLSQLRDADTGLRKLQQMHAEEIQRIQTDERSARQIERSAWHAERERLRRDRERTAWLLVDAEQRIASLLLAVPETADELPDVDLEIDEVEQVIKNLQKEVLDLRSSTSWRVTRPLRTISGLLRNRKP